MTPDQLHAARRIVNTPSGRIAYVERGAGPVALFVHGVPLNGYHWRHQLEALGLFFPEERPEVLNALLREHWDAAATHA